MEIKAGKMARLMRRGKFKKVGDSIDPMFIEPLEKEGVFLEVEDTQYTLKKITKIMFKEVAEK